MTTVNDIALDQITGHSVDLLRVDAGLREKILDVLNVLEENLVKKLEKAKLHEVEKTATQRKRLEKLLSQTKKTISTAYNDIDKIEDKELIDLARVAEKQAVRTINTAIKASTLSVGMSKEMLESIGKDTLITGAPSKEWWQRQSQTFESTFKDTVRQGLLSGKPTAEIVRELMGTKTARYKDGKLEPRRRGAEALVRTSVQVVANEARMQTYENNNDIVKGIEWVSTLDSRTSPICRVLDGLMWDNERKPINHSKSFPGATAHWNCRSTQVPILKSWEELGAKKKFKEIPEGTRASMDGQVSAKEGYEDWLKGKDEEFQKDVLGKGKWELWKAGKVGFTDLVDQTGNPVSLEVLREKLGIEKVGGALQAVKGRGVKGDDLLNVQDLMTELEGVGAQINLDGTVRVYHRTSPENAAKIRESGEMFAKEPDIFFSTSVDSEYGKGFGDSVVAVDIPIEDLQLDDIFPGKDASVSIGGHKLPIGKAVKVNVTGEKLGIAFPDAVASTMGEPVKAVNERRAAAKSNPIEVFHSTNADFTEFDQGKSIGGQMWFTSSKDMAEAGFDGAQSGRVVKAQIDIRNPAGWDEYDKFGTDELIAQGFDGVKLESGDEISYIAFFPEQVKVDSNLPSIINISEPIPPEGRRLNKIIESGRYDVKELTPLDWQKERGTRVFEYTPRGTERLTEKTGQHGEREWFDEDVVDVERIEYMTEFEGENYDYSYNKATLKEGWLDRLSEEGEPGIIYRGMSDAEYKNYLETDEIKSKGEYNISGQEGQTLYTTQPQSAATYASDFAPPEHSATPDNPAYVVAVRDPGTGVRTPGTGAHEIGIPGTITKNDVVGVYEGRVYHARAGETEIIHDLGRTRDGSGRAPDAAVAWKQITPLKTKENPYHKPGAEDITSVIKNNPDGFTVDLETGEQPTKGFVVAPVKSAEIKIKAKELTPSNVREFAKNIRTLSDISNKKVYAGGWFNSEDEHYYLDAVEVVDHLADALYTAEASKQEAIFNIGEGNEIKTKEGVKGLKKRGVYRSEAAHDRRRDLSELAEKFEEARDKGKSG